MDDATQRAIHAERVARPRSGGGRSRRRPVGASVDRGVTFVELLVALALLGIGVVGTLALLRSTVLASGVNRDLANAQAWLQSASANVEQDAYVPCSGAAGDVANVIGGYSDVLPPAPDSWTGADIAIADVSFWGPQFDEVGRLTGGEAWGPGCYSATAGYTDAPHDLQLITITVTSPDGDFSRSLEVIRGG